MPSALTTLAWLKRGLLGPLVEDLMMKFQGAALQCESSYGKIIISSYTDPHPVWMQGFPEPHGQAKRE